MIGKLMKPITKTCTKCGEAKVLEEFRKHPTCKFGREAQCRLCRSKQQKTYRSRPEIQSRINARARAYYARPEVKSRRLAQQRAYNSRPEIKSRMNARKRAYHARPEVKSRVNARDRNRRKTDPNYQLKNNCRARVRSNLKKSSTTKTHRTHELIGTSYQKLKLWLEMQFTPGMSWSNYGINGWEIDHYIACDDFDLTDPEQQRKCFHYTNMQPMWAPENRSKGAKFQPSRYLGDFHHRGQVIEIKSREASP